MNTSTPPPGYVDASHLRSSGEIAVGVFLPVASLLLAVDQLLIIQPNVFLHTNVGPSETLSRWVMCSCGTAFGLFARVIAKRWFGCTPAMLAASVGTALSGPVQFWAISQPEWASWLAAAPSILAASAIGAIVGTLPYVWRATTNADELTRVILQPFMATALLATLCGLAVLSSAIGPLRSSLAVAGGLAAAAPLLSGGLAGNPTVSAFRASGHRVLSYALLAIYAGGAYAAQHHLPLHRVLASSNPVAFYAQDDRCTLQVTSGQGAYHLFVDGELRFSTFDNERWAESLVLPALARTQRPRRALVLSTGEGLLERELLTDSGIESITSVARCALAPELAKNSAWLRKLTESAMVSPRVEVTYSDPAAYLVTTPVQSYDIIVVDLPDPAGPRQTKYYSRYFYRLLAERMHAESILVVQATSARRSPRTFATIGATIRAAGLNAQPAVVPLISRGEWSLYFCAKGPIPDVLRPELQVNSLADRTVGQFFNPWPDCSPPKGFVAETSTLYDAKVLDWFERESEPTPDLEGLSD